MVGGALIFFVALRLGPWPILVLGVVTFLVGVFLTKWSKRAKATIGLILVGIMITLVALILGHHWVALFGWFVVVGIGFVFARVFYRV
jgi:peptidoglycan/LPS O-acetylase OafA/YrhL